MSCYRVEKPFHPKGFNFPGVKRTSLNLERHWLVIMFMPSFLLWYICNVWFCSQVGWKDFLDKKELVFSEVDMLERFVVKGGPVGGFLISVLLLQWEIHGGGGAQGCVWRNCWQSWIQDAEHQGSLCWWLWSSCSYWLCWVNRTGYVHTQQCPRSTRLWLKLDVISMEKGKGWTISNEIWHYLMSFRCGSTILLNLQMKDQLLSSV